MENTNDTTPAYDAGEQRHVARRAKTAKATRLQDNDDFRWLMGDARGRRLVWHWLAAARIYESSMGPSPEATAFNEGRRNAGLVLLADVNRICPADYATMMVEAQPQSSDSNGEEDVKSDAEQPDAE
jgi:hypothetical protein